MLWFDNSPWIGRRIKETPMKLYLSKQYRLAFVACVAVFVTALALAQDIGAGIKAFRNCDYTTALRNFGPLAKQGDSKAQCALGLAYKAGKGVNKNHATAVQWFGKSAKQGNSAAQTELGYMYMFGQGVKRNPKNAAAWFRCAAEAGHSKAQLSLGIAYILGQGVQPNDVLAYKWLTLAKIAGQEKAAEGLTVLESSMTAAQIAKAKKLINGWSPKTAPDQRASK